MSRNSLTSRGRIGRRVLFIRAGFRSLTEAVDTTTAAGRMLTQMLGSFAEFERAMIRERKRASLAVAREQGRRGGRPPKLREHQRAEIIRMVRSGKKTPADPARLFRVNPSTVSRVMALARHDPTISSGVVMSRRKRGSRVLAVRRDLP